jgi:Lecithin retinol acyltransferase
MRGDHLIVDRGVYRHHGIDRGDGTVVHFAGTASDKKEVSVRLASLEGFVGGGSVWVRRYGERLDPEETVRRAESMVGECGYSLVSNNCEHLASWCATGVAESRQVERITATGGGTAVALAASLGCADFLASIGSVGGVSGPGVMSALSSAGGLVLGGAVQGLYVLGLVPGLLGTAAVFYATRDKPSLTEEERQAHRCARWAAGIGGTATGLAGIGAVGAMGSVAGLSGPGIASGLAAIGGLAGGGMVAGVGLVIAAPAVAAGLLGWLAYRLALWLEGRSGGLQPGFLVRPTES